ncbi:MAG: kinetochore-associated Ndc80 complex subunit ndc80 [Caeruleum heppii]|nr:MAG: kinetochore-associated Ndc80 complex subunit ndc80 [Caeruleum heppii]
MSQDTGLFSVRRPRETLGGLNFNSGIPQPASALKRSNSISGLNQSHQAGAAPYTTNHARSTSGSRASLAPPRPPNQPMFQRSSSGSNLAEMGSMSTVKRTSSSQMFTGGAASTGRKSYAMGSGAASAHHHQSSSAADQQRRSSVYSRPSSMGMMMGHQSFFQQGPMPAGVPRDPRPLRDRSYQARIGQEILDYLTSCGFEMTMKHSLSQNTLKSPTQKDFTYIFQWLYHRIDPSYRFVKNIDAEVPLILKQLRYPYEKSITKSQITAVGGQNWSTFLGMLHWMMQLAVMLDGYEHGRYDDACADAGVDVGGDRIIFNFLSKGYKDWLSVEDDAEDGEDDADKVLAPHVAAMAAEFNQTNAKNLQELQVLEAAHQALLAQIAEVESTGPDVAKLDEHHKILEQDKVKFEQWNSSREAKADKYETRVKFLIEEIGKAEDEMREAEREKATLQEAVDRQGITVPDIDRMNAERERLQRASEATMARLDDARRRVAEKESDASAKLDELERMVDQYNSLGYQIALIPSTALNAKGRSHELILTISAGPNFSSSTSLPPSSTSPAADSDRLLADPLTGYSPHHLLNLDLRGSTKTTLISLRKEINERRALVMEETERNRELLEQAAEAIEDKKAEVEALEHRVRAAEEEFERTKEVTTTQKLASDAQIEKMEKTLAKMRAGLSESVQVMEQREMNTNIQYEQLTLRCAALREELHTEVERMLNDVIKFKVHVQERIEDFDAFVEQEVEVELKEGGEAEAEVGEDGMEERVDEE